MKMKWHMLNMSANDTYLFTPLSWQWIESREKKGKQILNLTPFNFPNNARSLGFLPAIGSSLAYTFLGFLTYLP
jgi:hypothetical protein